MRRRLASGIVFIAMLLVFFVLSLSAQIAQPTHAQTDVDHILVWRYAAQTISAFTWTTIDFDAENYDPNDSFDLVSDQFTVRDDRPHLFCGYVRFYNLKTNDTATVALQLNGAGYYYLDNHYAIVDDFSSILGGCRMLWLDTADYVKLAVYRTNDGNVVVSDIDGAFSASALVWDVYETPTPTDTPIPTDTPTPIPTTDPDPFDTIITDTLTSGDNWLFDRTITAGEIMMGVVGLILLAVAIFRILGGLV